MKMDKSISSSRRRFIKSTAAMGTLPFLPSSLSLFSEPSGLNQVHQLKQAKVLEVNQSIIGHYGPWAKSLVEDPAPLSFRRDDWSDLDEWKGRAGRKMWELLAPPDTGGVPKLTVLIKYL